jgi:hypothetical protein
MVALLLGLAVLAQPGRAASVDDETEEPCPSGLG